MQYSHQLRVRVSPATQQRIRDAARAKMVTESVWLRQCIERALADTVSEPVPAQSVAEPPAGASRISIRIHFADGQLLKAVAQSRGLPTASYVSLLVRAYLHGYAPVPPEELRALRESTEHIGRITRYLTQLDAFIRRAQSLPPNLAQNVENMLRLNLTLGHWLRDYIRSNIKSWEIRGGPNA
jgi:hypothetical protein